MASDPLEAARAVLRERFGFSDFRPGQAAAVRAALRGRDLLAVLPTGAGKSLCFQLPALMEPALTVVASPLVSLMDDQVGAALARGLPAGRLTSLTPPAARRRTEGALRRGELRLLYVSPERMANGRFQRTLAGLRVARVVVDEAHCISEWGHDFRPAYRRIGAFRRAVGDPPASAFTATATPTTRADVEASLGLRRPVHLIGRVDRPNLRYEVRRATGLGRAAAEALAATRRALRAGPGAALLYAATRDRAARLAAALRRLGVSAAAYHAGLTPGERRRVQEAFLEGSLRTVAATNAFGMGVDRPDVRLVCHVGAPGSLEAYVQEAGRAGRDGRPARCLLLACPGDGRLHRALLRSQWPSARLLDRVWQVLPSGSAVTPTELAERLVGGRKGEPPSRSGAWPVTPRRRPPEPTVVEAACRMLVQVGGARLAGPEGRVCRVPGAGREAIDFGLPRRGRRRARRRLRALLRYTRSARCRRAVIAAYFEEAAPACAGCDRCA